MNQFDCCHDLLNRRGCINWRRHLVLETQPEIGAGTSLFGTNPGIRATRRRSESQNSDLPSRTRINDDSGSRRPVGVSNPSTHMRA